MAALYMVAVILLHIMKEETLANQRKCVCVWGHRILGTCLISKGIWSQLGDPVLLTGVDLGLGQNVCERIV